MPTVRFRYLVAWLILLSGLFYGWSIRDHFSPRELGNVLLGILFLTSKVATVVCLSPAEQRQWTPWRFALYLVWAGMRPKPFLASAPDDSGPRPTVTGFLLNLTAGVVLLWAAPLLLPPGTPLFLRVWVGIVGLAFLVLFAIMDAWALLYRALGIPVAKLWVSPVAATSVRAFWGLRWNRVFSGMLRDVLFRPLARPLGPVGAALAVFLYSGLLHENLAVVVRTGYGGPTAYFLIQAGAFLAEGTRRGRALLHDRPWLGWCWTAVVVVGPLSLLLPAAYMDTVVVPMLTGVGVPGLGPTGA